MLDKYRFTDKEKSELLQSMIILIDTREKINDHIRAFYDSKSIPYKVKKLDYGDYSFMIPKNERLGIMNDLWFDKEIIVERKASLEELSGNLAQNRSRFEEELALSPKNKILLIENASYKDIVNGNYNTKFNKKSFLSTLHTYWFRYDCPFVFMEDKKITPIFIKLYFENYLKHVLR